MFGIGPLELVIVIAVVFWVLVFVAALKVIKRKRDS